MAADTSSGPGAPELVFDYASLRDRIYPPPSAPVRRPVTIIDEFERRAQGGPPKRVTTFFDWESRPWFQFRDRLRERIQNDDEALAFLRGDLQIRSVAMRHVEGLRAVVLGAKAWARRGGWRPGAQQSFYRCETQEDLLHYLTKSVSMRVRSKHPRRLRLAQRTAADIAEIGGHAPATPEEILMANETLKALEDSTLEALLQVAAAGRLEERAAAGLVASLSDQERSYLELRVRGGMTPAEALDELGEVDSQGRIRFVLHQRVQRKFRRRGLGAAFPTQRRRRRGGV